jgi:hypothetical protein
MANPFSQKVRQRKFVYTALILVLFTVSLMHRRLWIEPEAERLKLREVAKGEVELTSSAVRLSLTGSRGLAVTFLWSAALKKQERHEWNELELLVGAITKLQPYFITPWLFQGWNLAYNVSVECDRPHDKYYYVSRGLNLLAEGERRNHEQGIGQPDLRHFIGIAYQGKFGTADEKITMRCLLDMSCIDPVRRDPERFWALASDGRRTVNLDELAKLCRDYPRLVRRLREHLGYSDPRQIVAFLSDNREVPTRFERPTGGFDQKETPLKKDIREQFPILPPAQGERPPNPSLLDFGLSQETMDLHVVSRAWFEYAQQPVPPPSPDPNAEAQFDRMKYRLPKAPALPIFRGYPARAQAFSAEVMQEEGWFDADGWLIRDWFDGTHLGADEEFRVGTDPKYHAAPAWERAYRMYKDLGVRTGLYMTPGERADLEQKAGLFRKKYKVGPGEMGPPALAPEHRQQKPMVESFSAHNRLAHNAYAVRVSNYDGLFYQTEAERTVNQVTARKLLYQAERLRRFENPEQALTLFEAAWPLWIGTSIRFPKFAEQGTNQEDAYELQLKHLRLMQKQYPVLYRSLATGLAQLAVWPHAPLEDLLDSSDKTRILPIRNVRGLLDSARVYQGAEQEEFSRFLLAWTQGAGTPRLYVFPGQEDWTLVTFVERDQALRPGWRHLIDSTNIEVVKGRLGLLPPPPAVTTP